MKSLLAVIFVLSLAFYVNALRAPLCRSIGQLKVSKQTILFAGSAGGLDEDTREKIDSVIKKNKVVLFMKGNKLFPQWYVNLLPPHIISSF